MRKIQAIPKPLNDAQELEKITQETLAITKKNDSDLTDDEKLIIKSAIKLNIQDYPIIFPLRATIGFMVRNMDGKNQQAIEFIRASLPANAPQLAKSYIMRLVEDFDALDEDSRNRVDCLDWLCRKNKITPTRFLEAVTTGIVVFNNHMTTAIIASKKPDIASKIIASAENESLKSHHHKKLAAQMAGLIDDKPIVQIDTGDKTTNNNVTNNNVVLTFSDFVRQNDKNIRGQIGEMEKDYVEGEIIND